VGYEAAALLARLMAGGKTNREPAIVKPLGVIARQSTDILAIDDREVAHALHFIRRHACDGIKVNDVVNVVSISRRSLEQRFQAALGRSPKIEIQRVKLERAKMLLATTDLPMDQISRLTGFGEPSYFSTAFKNETGVKPSSIRRRGTNGNENAND
jgi:LacI family transcriptional regulator